MSRKIYFVIFVLLTQISCFGNLNDSYSAKAQPTTGNLNGRPSLLPTTPLPCQYPQLDNQHKQSLYVSLLGHIVVNSALKTQGNITYRDRTIQPKYIEQINNVYTRDTFAQTLINNFIKANEKTYPVERNYDSKTNIINSKSGSQDIVKFYEEANSSVVAFSNIGIDDSHRQALVYMEFYGDDKTVIRKYLHLILKKDESLNDVDKIIGVYAIEEYPVEDTPKQ